MYLDMPFSLYSILKCVLCVWGGGGGGACVLCVQVLQVFTVPEADVDSLPPDAMHGMFTVHKYHITQ